MAGPTDIVVPNANRFPNPQFYQRHHRISPALVASSVPSWRGDLAKPVERRSQRWWVDLVRTCPILDAYFAESRAPELVVNAPMIGRCRNLVVPPRLQEHGSASEALV